MPSCARRLAPPEAADGRGEATTNQRRIAVGAESFAKDCDTYGVLMVGQMALRPDEPVPPLGIMGWEAIGVSSWGWIECQVRLQRRWDTEGH